MPTVVIPKSVEDKQKEEAKRLGLIDEFIAYGENGFGEKFTYVWLSNGVDKYGAFTTCSKKDQFCKRTGRVIARGRVLKRVKNYSVDRVPQEK